MQSIFSPAARRDTLRGIWEADRRGGELKMDWTKPLDDVRPMGVEWLADSRTREVSSPAAEDSRGPEAWRVKTSAVQDEFGRGGRQGFPAEMAKPNR